METAANKETNNNKAQAGAAQYPAPDRITLWVSPTGNGSSIDCVHGNEFRSYVRTGFHNYQDGYCYGYTMNRDVIVHSDLEDIALQCFGIDY